MALVPREATQDSNSSKFNKQRVCLRARIQPWYKQDTRTSELFGPVAISAKCRTQLARTCVGDLLLPATPGEGSGARWCYTLSAEGVWGLLCLICVLCSCLCGQLMVSTRHPLLWQHSCSQLQHYQVFPRMCLQHIPRPRCSPPHHLRWASQDR